MPKQKRRVFTISDARTTVDKAEAIVKQSEAIHSSLMLSAKARTHGRDAFLRYAEEVKAMGDAAKRVAYEVGVLYACNIAMRKSLKSKIYEQGRVAGQIQAGEYEIDPADEDLSEHWKQRPR